MRAALALAAAALLLLAAGCGNGAEPPPDAKLVVYLSVPLSGEQAREGRAVAAGAREALEAAGGEAAGVAVEATVLDAGPGASPVEPEPGDRDAEAGPAPRDRAAVRAAENARDATQDSTAIAYIGELDSAPTRTSLPITNDARLLQVSPSAGAVDLVAPFEGSDKVPPETQPSGGRTFATLAALDGDPRDLGAEAMALVLDAVERAEDPLDRASVVAAFLATPPRDSPLGPYSFDDVGQARPLPAGSEVS